MPLVLDRKIDQEILIGDALLRIMEIGRGRVKIAISAPPSIRIIRPDATNQAPRGENQ